MSEPRELKEARAELRRMGYLTHRLDRFLLQDALRTQASPGTVLRTAAKVGLLAGSGLACAATLALGLANDLLRASPADLFPLFVHLLIPLVVAAGLLYLLLADRLVNIFGRTSV